jgi:hypothetical protein
LERATVSAPEVRASLLCRGCFKMSVRRLAAKIFCDTSLAPALDVRCCRTPGKTVARQRYNQIKNGGVRAARGTLGEFMLLAVALAACGNGNSNQPQTSPQVSVAPSSLVFGSVTVGGHATQSLTVSNRGNASLSITAANVKGAGFSTNGLSLPVTLAPGGTSPIAVDFTPSTAGNFSGNLSLTNNVQPSPMVIALNGTGVAATVGLTASSLNLNFGNVILGSTGSQNVTLTSVGNSSVTISQVTVSGAGFRASGVTSMLTLAAGQSITLVVTFAPSSLGSVNGSLTIGSNVPGAPLNVSLLGSGIEGTSDAMIPSTFFGMHVVKHVSSTSILPPIAIGALGKGAATFWSYLEPSRGNYSWSSLDRFVSRAGQLGVPYFQGQAYVPQWAVTDTSNCFASAVAGINECPSPPFDLTMTAPCQGVLAATTTTNCQWKEFITAMVQRYKTTGVQAGCGASNPQCNGVIQTYEGWNEPPGAHAMSSADFIILETDFLNIVRANDPGAEVCSPAFIIDPAFPSYATFMNNFFANGGPKTFDCYDFHINAPTPEAQIAHINQFKSILSNNGIDPETHAIYATEAGRWGACATSPSGMTEQAYIARIELLYWSNNVKRHYWYAYDTCGPLTNQSTTPTLNAAGVGYGVVQGWMIGTSLSERCAANGTVWTCGFSSASGYRALAIWDTAGSSSYTPAGQYTQYLDLEGGTHSISGSVTIGTEPILLINGIAP